MIGLLVALYPAAWRRRYGEEFRAVLESRPVGPFDVADVLLGALDARLSGLRFAAAPTTNVGGHRTMLRVGGFGAIAGGTLWVTGFLGGSTFDDSIWPWWLFLGLGTFSLLVALVGLSAFQAHRYPRLAWAALVIPALGSVVSIVGMVGMAAMPDTDAPLIGAFGSWAVWALGAVATLVGCILFGAVTVRASVLSRPGAAGLAVSSVATLVIAVGGIGIESADAAVGYLLLALSLVGFAASWIVLGVSALRRGPIRGVVPAAG